MHISQIEPWTFFAKPKQKKEKQLARLTEKYICIDFEVWPVNRRFVQEADVLVRERRRTQEFIQICTRENKTAV